MAGDDIASVLHKQRVYYEARAAEYDDAYRRTGLYDRGADKNAAWHADLARLTTVFDRVDLRGEVVELAGGTGYWTARLVDHAASLTVIDGSAKMLRANRRRLGARAERVEYQVADLFDWRPARQWDACVFGFWLCHVPDDRIVAFLDTVAGSLRPGGVVCFVDKAAATDIAPDVAPERVERKLNDGRRYTIVDHLRRPEAIEQRFAAAGMTVEVETIGGRFCIGRGARGAPTSP